jgi:hypothetical protein
LEVFITTKTIYSNKGRTLSSEDEAAMKKPKWTPEEKAKLQALRDEIERYQNILQWQKIRQAEKQMLKLREKFDYRSYRRELLLDKYLVTLRYKKKWKRWLDDA